MEESCCYSCGSRRNSPYANENGYALVKCAECGLLFVNPRPDDDDITRAVQCGIHQGTRAFDATGSFRRKKIRHYLKILTALFGDGSDGQIRSWLDIGCGYGELLMAVKKWSGGLTATKGLEPNVRKQRAARKLGLDVSYFDLDSHTATYDVVSLLNVYSHVPDPASLILSCKRLFKPDGKLLLETGDTARMDREDHPRPFYLPDHLSFASEAIVRKILERNGFSVVNVKKYPLVTWDLPTLAKEVLKVFLKGRESQLRNLARIELYREADMYVLAQVTAGQ